jgi:hypothetical protein
MYGIKSKLYYKLNLNPNLKFGFYVKKLNILRSSEAEQKLCC